MCYGTLLTKELDTSIPRLVVARTLLINSSITRKRTPICKSWIKNASYASFSSMNRMSNLLNVV